MKLPEHELQWYIENIILDKKEFKDILGFSLEVLLSPHIDRKKHPNFKIFADTGSNSKTEELLPNVKDYIYNLASKNESLETILKINKKLALGEEKLVHEYYEAIQIDKSRKVLKQLNKLM